MEGLRLAIGSPRAGAKPGDMEKSRTFGSATGTGDPTRTRDKTATGTTTNAEGTTTRGFQRYETQTERFDATPEAYEVDSGLDEEDHGAAPPISPRFACPFMVLACSEELEHI